MFDFVDRWINKLEAKPIGSLSIHESVRLIKINLEIMLDEQYKTLLLTGSISEDELSNIYQILQNECRSENEFEFLFGEDITHNEKTVAKLLRSDGIVLVEKNNVSTFEQVKYQINKIQEYNKKIVGYIYINN